MTLKDLISEESSELYVMSFESMARRYDTGLEQVYDATLKGWMSIENHLANITNYFEQVSDKNTAEHYIKHYYSNILKDFYEDDEDEFKSVSKYVCFFITPHEQWDDEEVCVICGGGGYMDCDACNDERSRIDSYRWCDECDDSGLVECFSCNSQNNPSQDYLIGAVSWYSFQTPYTDDENNAIYIDSIIHFGVFQFIDPTSTHSGGSPYALNQNEVSDDVTSALVWSKISEIEEVRAILNDSSISSSYYGFISNYDSLIQRIGTTIGLKITNAIGGMDR